MEIVEAGKVQKSTQFEILTGIKAYINDNSCWNANIFYCASQKTVEQNWQKAKEVYKYIFNAFVNSYCIMQSAKKSLPLNTPEDIESNQQVALDMIKNQEIKPMPGYLELKELKI